MWQEETRAPRTNGCVCSFNATFPQKLRQHFSPALELGVGIMRGMDSLVIGVSLFVLSRSIPFLLREDV